MPIKGRWGVLGVITLILAMAAVACGGGEVVRDVVRTVEVVKEVPVKVEVVTITVRTKAN